MKKLILTLYIECWANLIYNAITEKLAVSKQNSKKKTTEFGVYKTTENQKWAFENIEVSEVMALFIGTLETHNHIAAYELMQWIKDDIRWEFQNFEYLQSNKKLLDTKIRKEYDDARRKYAQQCRKQSKRDADTKNKRAKLETSELC